MCDVGKVIERVMLYEWSSSVDYDWNVSVRGRVYCGTLKAKNLDECFVAVDPPRKSTTRLDFFEMVPLTIQFRPRLLHDAILTVESIFSNSDEPLAVSAEEALKLLNAIEGNSFELAF